MAPPEVLIAPAPEHRASFARTVAERLEDGAVVALPTETVYGLCCRAHRNDARARIYGMKGRTADKPLPYLIPDAASVQVFVNEVTRATHRLAERFWPGPLTLVLGPGGGVAVRVPDHPVTQQILHACRGPVQATSANRSGDAPATTAEQVVEVFPDELDLVVDGGPASLAAASTVVRIHDGGRVEVLREGGLPTQEVLPLATTSIAVVCTGNTCRSPMAAVVVRETLAAHLQVEVRDLPAVGIRVESSGLAAWPGAPMTEEAARALEGAGFTVPDHRSRPWTDEMATAVDRVWVMTQSHRAGLLERFPALAGRVELLDPDGEDVPDPYGGDAALYAGTLRQLQEVVARRLREAGMTPSG